MKKKLRSILALLMAILMVAACTACGSGGNGGTASGSSKLQEVLDRGYLIVGTGSTKRQGHPCNLEKDQRLRTDQVL